MKRRRAHSSGVFSRLRSPQRIAERLLAVLAVLSMALAGFAHTAVAAPNTNSAYSLPAGVADNLEFYRLPDGTLPIFCVSLDGEDGPSNAECEFCRLADSAAVTALTTASKYRLKSNVEVWTFQTAHAGQAVSTTKARAPPTQI